MALPVTGDWAICQNPEAGFRDTSFCTCPKEEEEQKEEEEE